VSFRFLILCLCVALAGCDKDPPSPPNTPPPGGVEQITGNERLGWDQRAATRAELATLRYNIYVDNTASEMQDVTCADAPGTAGFACSGRLPPMSNGLHRLELTAFVEAGVRLESARSTMLSVTMTRPSLTAPSSAPVSVVTSDGIELLALALASGLDDPTDLAVAPDGRLFIAERAGRIRIVRDGDLRPAPAVVVDDVVATDRRGLLTIAIDPDFEKTGHLFAVYTALNGFRLVRFRAVGDTLGDRVILLDGVDAPLARPAASLRFGPDARLYLGLDDAGDPARPGDLGSFNGKVLRLNADGTTPPDQAGGTPVYALHVGEPRGIGWSAGGGTLWIVEETRLQAVASSAPAAKRGTPVAHYRLPAGTGPGGAAFYKGDLIRGFAGDLLVASDEGRAILRLRFDPGDPRTIAASEQLLRDQVGGIRTIGVDRAGVVYFCTASELFALIPAPAPEARRP
jgi:glucose/arabinose dehydrogenase